MSGLVVVRGESASMSLTERIRTFFKEVQVEIRKVSWPTRTELRDSTIVVIATVLIVAAYVGAVDRVLGTAIGVLFR